MSVNCRTHRGAPAPLSGPQEALDALAVATEGGRLPAAVVACLDAARRPLTMFVLDHCPPDASPLLLALEVLLDAIDRQDGVRVLAELVLATSRPGGSDQPTAEDLGAWDQLDELCDRNGISLLDWFVLADGRACSVPGVLGEPDRW
ncbi:MAG: hypothetical protein NVS1B12_07390 [Acidimicrobiales bacterium]